MAEKHEKHEKIKFLGFELKGYTWKKLVVQSIIAVATVGGTIHQFFLHGSYAELEHRSEQQAAVIAYLLEHCPEKPKQSTMPPFGVAGATQGTGLHLKPSPLLPSSLQEQLEAVGHRHTEKPDTAPK